MQKYSDVANPTGLRVEFERGATRPDFVQQWQFSAPLSPPGLAGQPNFQNVAFDDAGNLLISERFFADGCPFGFCGSHLLSITPEAQVRWELPSPPFPYFNKDLGTPNIVLGSSNSSRAYFLSGRNQVSAFDAAGNGLPGWPKSATFADGTIPRLGSGDIVGFAHYGNSGVIVDWQDGTVYAANAAVVNAFRDDGTWKSEPLLVGGISGIAQGQQGDLYTIAIGAFASPNTIAGINHETGLPFCSQQYRFTGPLVSGDFGLFSVTPNSSQGIGNTILRFVNDCTPVMTFTTSRLAVVPWAVVSSILLGVDANETTADAASAR